MEILAIASDEQWAELTGITSLVDWIRLNDLSDIYQNNDATALFNLKDNAASFNYSSLKKTVFINSVCTTLKEIHTPHNVVRINGWNTFIKRSSWEIAGTIDNNVKSIIEKLNRKIIEVPDEPGLIAARTIAMIINEAYFALEDNVSSKKEIDIAMKLGTNYPYGPFEWAEAIGIKNIFTLLKKLSAEDMRYKPAPLLIKEASKAG